MEKNHYNTDYTSYDGFARVYDMFMDDVPYKEWSDYLVKLLGDFDIEDGIILDLGCGTGKMTRLLSDSGYDMIGIDSSDQMLTKAREETEEASHILYLLQDMREFELYGTVKAVVSICDSINYMLSDEDMIKCFSLVNNYLDPGGIFIFDLNTIYKYSEILSDQNICENREESSFIWENYYDTQTQLNEYALTLFIKERGDLYRKYEEIHYQRGYSLEKIIELLQVSGLKFVIAYDAFTMKPVKSDSERIYVIAKEYKKRRNEGNDAR